MLLFIFIGGFFYNNAEAIQGTFVIKNDTTGGDCVSIGIWDFNSKICTLTSDISAYWLINAIQILDNDIILDGNNHIIVSYYSTNGVYISGKSGITVKNLHINNAGVGIRIEGVTNSNFVNNSFSYNIIGVYSFNSSNNKFLNNISNSSNHEELLIHGSHYNLISENNLNGNVGISLPWSDGNQIVNNVINSKYLGIYSVDSERNAIKSNVISGSSGFGIYMNRSSYNEILLNTISNSNIGLQIVYGGYGQSWLNKIYNNNFINNPTQAVVERPNENFTLFNLPFPDGGNYWDNFSSCNDLNNDNICDSPYIFTGGQDNLPWTKQDGWKLPQNQPPKILNLNQYKSDSQTLISEGQTTAEDNVVFKATPNDVDNDQVKLQIELKEYNQPFDGQNLLESGFVSSGSETTITRDGLTDGQYHWQARAVDDKGNASDWQEFGIAGNVDFTVHTVPLYTQVVSQYPYRLPKDEWADLNYANGGIGKYSCAKTENATIKKCGCAITSMVMLGRYYNINFGIDGTNVDPGSINYWLTSNKGYLTSYSDINGSLIWGKAMEYLGNIENGVKKTHLTLDFYNASSTADGAIINNYLDSAKPAIAYSGRFGHYFVIDNKLAATYGIKDPAWYNTKTLNDSDNPTQYVRGYGNKFDKANLFSYLPVSKQISAAMYFYLASPAEYLITDPQGRRLGTDPITDVSYNEIPDASYSSDGPIVSSDAPLDQNSLHQVKTLYISNPLDGNYDVKVIGTGTGSYTVIFVIYDNNGNSKTENLYGNTLPNLSADYNLNFTAADSQNVILKPKDTEPPIISHTLINKEYVLNSASIVFDFSAQDVETGVFKTEATINSQPISSGYVLNFDKIGAYEIMVTSTDFVGNVATATINYSVAYNFGGFLPPVKADGSGIYKLGRTLPVKFQLKDAKGNFISTAVAKLYVAKIKNGVVGIDEISFSSSNADNNNQFRYDNTNNQYIYNLSTNNFFIGSWRLKIILDDEKSYIVDILIK